MSDTRSLRVALLGAGTVGGHVARLLLEHHDELAARAGVSLDLVGIAVRDVNATRAVDLPADLFTTDAETLIQGADIVIELIGGIEPAKSYILSAIGSGADVVTGNKALLAEHGAEIFAAAARVGAEVYYEAAVAAAIPIIRPLRDSLAGDHVERILAIVNGSTNYILDRMDRFSDSMEDAQRVALELGYLEADPTLDVEGYDAAQKAAILAGLAFHTSVPAAGVHREGISSITLEDVESAREAGYVIKLLAIAERVVDDAGVEGVSARVHPALVRRDHPLASVHGGNNAVFVEAEAAGPLMFYGAGAGGVQTASAVLGDVVSIARRHLAGGVGVGESVSADLPVHPIGAAETRYRISLEVDDRPGVLAELAGILASRGVSVETLQQSTSTAGAGTVDGVTAGGETDRATATLVIGTHTARDAALAAAVDALSASDAVESVRSVLRIEGA